MPPQLQSKLLRALETRSFFRVGGVKKVDVDVRLLAATNRDPETGRQPTAVFRPDLMYRINSFEVNIPPLRERREDIDAACPSHPCESSAEQIRPSLRHRSSKLWPHIHGRAMSASFATVSSAPRSLR